MAGLSSEVPPEEVLEEVLEAVLEAVLEEVLPVILPPLRDLLDLLLLLPPLHLQLQLPVKRWKVYSQILLTYNNNPGYGNRLSGLIVFTGFLFLVLKFIL